tara:strand:+ start:7975 stop:8370 length:396 start_codon:yes stop_codon:yes gene_type:complete
MKLIERISNDFTEAYKAKDMDKKNFLGVIKTEVTKESKTPEDSYIISKIKSMIKNAEATNSLTDNELSILNEYLPTQMTEETLKDAIKLLIDDYELSSLKEMGKVMTYLKNNFDGQYDGRMASTITKELLQ